MAIKTFTTGEVLTAADTNTYLANSGLTYISKTTLGTGTTNILGCFSSTYDFYRVMFTNLTQTSAGLAGLRFLAGSTASITEYYYGGAYRLFSGGGGDETGSNVTYFPINSTSTTVPSSCVIDIMNPFLAVRTTFTALKSNWDAGVYITGNHNVATSYSGLQVVIAAGGNLAGDCTIMGYRKA
jgi:hypothetical protein